MGRKVPKIWARACAFLDALRDGVDPTEAASFRPVSLTGNPPVHYLSLEAAVSEWEKVAAASEFLKEIGPCGATSVLEDAIRLKESEGMLLFENGLVHLNPTWMNDLLGAILDHRLQDPAAVAFWEKELEVFCFDSPKTEFGELSNVHQTFCATGTLTASYLHFLWRKVEGVQQEGTFNRLLETMRKHGVLFSELGASSVFAGANARVDGTVALVVPVRLQPFVAKEKLKEFSAPCLIDKWRRQLVFRIWQTYVPPGIIGMFMSRLLSNEQVQLHCAWSRGISLMMGGSEVMLYLNPPEMYGGKAEIEVNVVGPKRSDEVEVKVAKMKAMVESVLRDNFPGLLFDLKGGRARSIEGEDALMERIDTLQMHLDVRLDTIEGALDTVAESSRESLMCIKNLQAPNYPYPHLVLVRENKPGGGNLADRRRKRVLSKALFKSFYTRARTVGKKEMTLQFLCPFDFSEVPCGPDGDGYRFEEARGWVKKVLPTVQVTAMIAKVALKAVSGLELEVSDFLNALKEGISEQMADQALDEESVRRVVLGEEHAGLDMQATCRASYEDLKKFLDNEQRNRRKHAKVGDGYVNFKDEMQLVADGKGGAVWVRNGNVQRWLTAHSIGPSA